MPAFSLVELVVVVVIIGVLAAIAVPRLSRGSSDAGRIATYRDLTIIERQIELYYVEHGHYPAYAGDGDNAAHTAAAFVSQMTKFSSTDGKVADTSSSTYRYGPYLRKGLPALKVGLKAGYSAIHVVTGATAPSYQAGLNVGWVYNDTTGEIIPNVSSETLGEIITAPQEIGGGAMQL
ncbi:MAG: prepilin-type N-terminal cleavage/methylation domain-containing protein [Planctomycetes bacterium]|nr:prepilin-type N-terminal cleavage/methylation domain-containing protein [Planctomycetota bacterium]